MKQQCTRVKYWTKDEAKQAVKDVNRKFKNDNLKDVYYCEECCFWHTTSMDKVLNRSLIRENEKQNGNSKAFTRYQNKGNRIPK